LERQSDTTGSGVNEPAAAAEQAGEEASAPSAEHARVGGRVNIRSLMLVVLGLLAVMYTLYFARPILMPLAVALLLSFVFMPPVRFVHHRLRLPHAASAAVVLLLLLVVIGVIFYNLSGPALTWVRELPESFRDIEQKLRVIREPVEDLQKAAKQVEEATSIDSSPGMELKVSERGALEVLLEEARWATASLLLMAGFLFFMLASGDTFLSKLVKVIPRFRDKKRAVAIVHEVQEDIAVYMLAITLINAGMGAAVGGVMLALGVPNAALWGVMATLLNYIPYVGAIVGVGVVALVSLATFDSVGYALLAPLTYTVLTSVEANVVTPLILGKRLRLNPLVLFAAVIFWGWVWGVPGAFVAVPITVAMRIIFDRVEQLRPLAEFFGR
jgi:predicted PurR-regulated permease PerM